MKELYKKLNESKQFLETIYDFTNIDYAIVLGSGLGNITDDMTILFEVKFDQIPHFPKITVEGHDGSLVLCQYYDKKILIYKGRYHFYEGYSMKEITYPIYLLKLLNITKLILTNSCGGMNKDLRPGMFMVINDFINLMPGNPLIGENDERLGTRFPDMTSPYDLDLIKISINVAKKLGIRYIEGVYAGFMGPYYETKAEIRAYSNMGADAIGMSTVPETIVANYLGIRVLGIATITNMATGIQQKKHSHSHVVEVANQAALKLKEWILEIIRQ